MERSFEIIRGLKWPSEVCRAWQELTDETLDASYAQTYYWNRACIEQLGFEPETFILIVARLGSRIEAIFPLTIAVERLFGAKIRVLRLPQHSHINLHDVALRQGGGHRNLMVDLFGFLNTQQEFACDVIDFGNVLEGSATYGLLCSESVLLSTVIKRRACNCLQVMSEDELKKHVSRNMRANMRKAQKMLDARNNIVFQTTRDSELLPRFFECFMEVEASGWKGRKGTATAISLDDRLVAFYRQLLDLFGRDGKCEINLLKIGSRIAAAQFALITGKTFYLLKIGYDQELAAAAPGHVLLAHTLSRLHAQGGIEAINLITDAAWHDRWRPTQLTVYEAKFYGKSLRGTMAYAYRRFRVRLGKWRRSLRAMVKRDRP